MFSMNDTISTNTNSNPPLSISLNEKGDVILIEINLKNKQKFSISISNPTSKEISDIFKRIMESLWDVDIAQLKNYKKFKILKIDETDEKIEKKILNCFIGLFNTEIQGIISGIYDIRVEHDEKSTPNPENQDNMSPTNNKN